MAKLIEIANENLQTHLVDNPCRGVVVGINDAGVPMQLSWIMGRSPNSQNRVYVVEDDVMRTEPADASKVLDPRLIIYNAMRSIYGAHVVTNGHQTDDVIRKIDFLDRIGNLYLGLGKGAEKFWEAMNDRFCEPDPTIFTARISGYQDTGNLGRVYLSVVKAEPFAREHWIRTLEESGLKKEDFPDADAFNKGIGRLAGLNHEEFPTLRDRFERPVQLGFGYMLTTYMPGSKELPAFHGEPVLVPMQGSLDDVMHTFWEALEPEWRVSLGGRTIEGNEPVYAEPINKFEKVGE